MKLMPLPITTGVACLFLKSGPGVEPVTPRGEFLPLEPNGGYVPPSSRPILFPRRPAPTRKTRSRAFGRRLRLRNAPPRALEIDRGSGWSKYPFHPLKELHKAAPPLVFPKKLFLLIRAHTLVIASSPTPPQSSKYPTSDSAFAAVPTPISRPMARFVASVELYAMSLVPSPEFCKSFASCPKCSQMFFVDFSKKRTTLKCR